MKKNDLTVLNWTKTRWGYKFEFNNITCTIIRQKELRGWGYSVEIMWQGSVHGDFYGETDTAMEAKLACEHVLEYINDATTAALKGA